DGRIENDSQQTIMEKLFTESFPKFSFGKLVLGLQMLIEKKIFLKEIPTVGKKSLIHKLNSISTIKVRPLKKDLLDVFCPDDSKKIQNYELDIILNLCFNTISGEILNSSKYGVWSLLHKDNSLNHYGPIGFWEVLNKESTIGFTLLQLTPEPNLFNVLDKAYFNLHWSFVETQNMVLEASVSVLFKNIRKFIKEDAVVSNLTTYSLPPYNFPNSYHVLKYTIGFYINGCRKIVRNLSSKLFGFRYECWTLFLGRGNFLDSKLLVFEPIKLPKHEFWADPFIFKHDNVDYVFFENLSYLTKRGKISCGIIKDNEIVNVVDVLDLNYHLSFPFIFEEDGEIYLMPETSENKRLEIYKCLDFPGKWELYSTAFEDEMVADAFFYCDKKNQRWLFLNKQAAITAPINSELFIYKVDSLKLDNLQPHTNNPVIIDARTARNGGAIFEYENEIYRPSQKNTDGIYGKGLNINKIEKLTIDEYVENKIRTIEPDFDPKLMAMHHLHQKDGLFVFDAAYKRKK
ncbi:MAG: hypothetical protein WBM53_07650, partial [Maribacter sp.]